MLAYAIVMNDNEDSLAGYRTLSQSITDTESNISLLPFIATQPHTIGEGIREVFGDQNVQWSWSSGPAEDRIDLRTGLFKRHYQAVDQQRVIACALSHMRLWKKCAHGDEPMMILEHDARFIRKFSLSDLAGRWGAVGLNDPRGNTRKGMKFHDLVASCGEGIHRVPVIDEPTEPPLPMGLAGNSAYIIKPEFASKLIEEMRTIGIWPNDAIMCRQLFPSLKVVYPYYTDVVKRGSTTTGI